MLAICYKITISTNSNKHQNCSLKKWLKMHNTFSTLTCTDYAMSQQVIVIITRLSELAVVKCLEEARQERISGRWLLSLEVNKIAQKRARPEADASRRSLLTVCGNGLKIRGLLKQLFSLSVYLICKYTWVFYVCWAGDCLLLTRNYFCWYCTSSRY